MTMTGRVKWFSERLGYGFVTVDEVDYILHASVLKVFLKENRGFKGLWPEAVVRFEPGRTERGVSVAKIIDLRGGSRA